MGLQRVPFNDFAGGVNYALSPYDLDTNEAQDAQNIRLVIGNAIKKREGTTQFDVSGYPAASSAANMKAWNRGATKEAYLSIEGDIYLSDAGGALTSKFNGTAATTWCFQPGQDSAQDDFLWCMNGTDAAKKVDDSGTVSNWAGTPPNGTMCVMWRNRMIITGVPGFPQRVFWSDIGNPESPTSGAYGNNWIDIKTTDDDLDPNTGLAVVANNLVVFKKNSTWVITDDVTFSNDRIAQVGCVNHYASAALEDRLYFFSPKGLYSTAGYGDVRFEGWNIEPWIYDNLNHGALSTIRVCATPDRRILCAVPTTEAYNTVLWEYCPGMKNKRSDGRTVSPWMPHTLNCSALCQWANSSEPKLFAGDSLEDRLLTLFDPAVKADVGVAFEAYWVSSWQSFQAQEPKERIRRLNIELSGKVVARLYRDFDIKASRWSKTFESDNVPVDPLWDGGTWDGGVWNEPQGLATFETGRPEARGRYHALKLENDELDTTFTIYAIEFAIRGGKEH